ncbi:hypothetical protein VTL71DRAFT_14720 [Oculimacula yallundae]|uniref:C2H2-type domain-containing protein n=1 Tax=Oculimacula yallundae TaxID=86028 RepID=A0ABR4CJ98_9HELO
MSYSDGMSSAAQATLKSTLATGTARLPLPDPAMAYLDIREASEAANQGRDGQDRLLGIELAPAQPLLSAFAPPVPVRAGDNLAARVQAIEGEVPLLRSRIQALEQEVLRLRSVSRDHSSTHHGHTLSDPTAQYLTDPALGADALWTRGLQTDVDDPTAGFDSGLSGYTDPLSTNGLSEFDASYFPIDANPAYTVPEASFDQGEHACTHWDPTNFDAATVPCDNSVGLGYNMPAMSPGLFDPVAIHGINHTGFGAASIPSDAHAGLLYEMPALGPGQFEQAVTYNSNPIAPASSPSVARTGTSARPRTHRCRISMQCHSAFNRRSDRDRHELTHDRNSVRTFSCSFPGCDYVGANGFWRADKFKEHREKTGH